MLDYSGKLVLVLGLGESGLAMARWLLHCGASVRVADTRAEPQRLPQLQALATEERISFVGGEFGPELLQDVAFVAVSPGLSPRAELAQILPPAAQQGIAFYSEIELFAQALAALRTPEPEAEAVVAEEATPEAVSPVMVQDDVGQQAGTDTAEQLPQAPVASAEIAGVETPAEAADAAAAADAVETVPAEDEESTLQLAPAPAAASGYRPKIIAITGTNGKTTVTSMVGKLCARAGYTVQVAGNISPAALDVLLDAILAGQLPQVWVLELSSFQLHFTYSLQADAATVLNLTQDHLDWHLDMAEYGRDKARIFGANTVRVLNRDDALVAQMQGAGEVSVISFGCQEPDRVGCFGLSQERGITWLSVAQADPEFTPKRRKKNEPAPVVPVVMKHLMPADALKIRGQHNAANALAALALCRALDLPFAPLLHALRDYEGEPHRVQLVRSILDVAWYDDSKGTNVGATVAALKGLGNEMLDTGQRLILLAGGVGKDQDFSPLAEPVARFVRAVVLFGRDAPAIRAALAGSGVSLVDAESVPQAVAQAAQLAQAGDAVLFSPACASFDMFQNYVHRARVFVEAVNELAMSHGEIV